MIPWCRPKDWLYSAVKRSASCHSCSMSASLIMLYCCDFAFDRVFVNVCCVFFDNSSTPAATETYEYSWWIFIQSTSEIICEKINNKVQKQSRFYSLFLNISFSPYGFSWLSTIVPLSALCLAAPWWCLQWGLILRRRYQLPMLPASSNTLTSCNVPFLLTILVSLMSSQCYKSSVRCTRLQYYNIVMEKV